MLSTIRKVIGNAISDVRAGLRLHRVWIALASEDIGDQHRRTTLGPLWLIINFLVMIAIFVFLFQRGQSVPNFPAYAATGLLVWGLISESVSQGVTLFAREESFIKGTTLPLSVYVMRLVMQSLIRTAYTSIGWLIIILLSDTSFSSTWAWALPGLLLLVVTMPAAIIIFAFLGAYFPDSQYIVSHTMRIGMFLTPIFWDNAGRNAFRSLFYTLNPFTHFIDIVRTPILFGTTAWHSFYIGAVICLLLWAVALPLLGRLRRQVAFVL